MTLSVSNPMNRRAFLGATATATAVAASGMAGWPGAFQRRATAAEVAWLSEVQTPPATLPPDAPQLKPLLVDAAGRPITTAEGWQKRAAELREQWRALLGDLGVKRDPLPKVEVLKEEKQDGVVRRLIKYDAEPGWATEAYLLEPDAPPPAGGRPVAAVFHSTVDHSIHQPAGLAGPPEKFFGLRLAQRGFACICPRNFLWPDNDHLVAQGETQRFQKLHPGVTGMARMLHDAQLALDIVLARPGVDPARVCAVGHSLGAKEVLYLAAFDTRVKVTVSSEGGVGTKFSNWDAPWYLGDRLKKPDFGHEQHELLGLIAPRSFLLIGGDSADGDRCWPFITAALPVYKLFGPVARLGLYNHKQGHKVPPAAEERTYQWIAAHI